MADIQMENQGLPAAPAAGKIILFGDTTSKRLSQIDDAGVVSTLVDITNQNTADVTANAVDTYLTGSGLLIPTAKMRVGTRFRWRLVMTKTAAGVAAPIWVIRVGTNGTTADTARCTLTSGSLQTAVIDTGWVDITAVIRSIGAAGVMAAGLSMSHNLAATGFASIANVTLQNTSAGFDTTVASLIVGISVNPGAAGVWAHQLVLSEALNL